MRMNRKEMLEFVESSDLSEVVALDVSTFSSSMNSVIGGRITRSDKHRMCIHSSFGLVIDMHILPYHEADLYFVKKGKNGAEYVSHHFHINLKSPFGDILVAITEKVEKEGGVLSKQFPSKRLTKCLSGSIVKIEDSAIGVAEGEDGYEEYYGQWAGLYGNPYGQIARSYTPREKKFYFKERGRIADMSK